MTTRSRFALAASPGAVLVLLVTACSGGAEPLLSPPEGTVPLTVTSPRLVNGDLIRSRYTCDGLNLSPEVSWSGAPDQTEAFVIIFDDPDAPGGAFTHWLVYDLPASVVNLSEGTGGGFDNLRGGGSQGMGDVDFLGYAGPCPPQGERHRYFLHVYALDTNLDLDHRGTRSEVVAGMDGHIVGHGAIFGLYERTQPFEQNVVFKPTPTP